jgi:hypothetical protein
MMNGFDFQVSIGDDMSMMFETFQPEILEHWPQTAAHRLIRGLCLNVSSPLSSSHSCVAPTPMDAVHVIHKTGLSLTILGWYTLWALLLLSSLDKAGLFDYAIGVAHPFRTVFSMTDNAPQLQSLSLP